MVGVIFVANGKFSVKNTLRAPLYGSGVLERLQNRRKAHYGSRGIENVFFALWPASRS